MKKIAEMYAKRQEKKAPENTTPTKKEATAKHTKQELSAAKVKSKSSVKPRKISSDSEDYIQATVVLTPPPKRLPSPV